ncbi:glutamic acid-rich protein-like [Impatiens glandulifera]|uniref:glutamic acid-rich protein-like n=1 Tax=Impatiens glandulifera TaxID=253017 RepID=UPI001FB07C23|nr:glutamic acid-rich protein-like [Impatiens glandulifera]
MEDGAGISGFHYLFSLNVRRIINIKILRMVENTNTFLQFPWGNVSFKTTLKGFNKDMEHHMSVYLSKKKVMGKKNGSRGTLDVAYTVFVFALALQMWTYEVEKKIQKEKEDVEVKKEEDREKEDVEVEKIEDNKEKEDVEVEVEDDMEVEKIEEDKEEEDMEVEKAEDVEVENIEEDNEEEDVYVNKEEVEKIEERKKVEVEVEVEKIEEDKEEEGGGEGEEE